MEYKELTNEKIRKKFENQFDLVNYAIRLAENMILTGRDPRVKTDSYNRSLHVLSEIIHDKDRFDEILTMDVEVETTPYSKNNDVEQSTEEKSKERKKSRKAFAK
jgi:hypothetical protein